MAKRKASRRSKTTKSKRASKRSAARRSVKRQTKKAKQAVRRQSRRRVATRSSVAKAKPAGTAKKTRRARRAKRPRLNRKRRVLHELTPPSSLDMDRHSSAAATGRRELQHSLRDHTGMTPAITGGDVDADWENAYFSGDEAPGGDNPTPDQDRVDDIGKSIGLQYDDSEELKGEEKIEERDKHRWELDPASSEDYRDRK